MLHLLKIEWLKVKNYRTFWVLSILYLISLYGVNYIVYYVQSATPRDNQMANAIIGTPPFQFPDVWHTVSYVSSFLLFIPGLLMIISFTNEYSFKTHRQNIIDGLSRRQFILVKILLTAIIALVSTITVFIVAFCYGLYEGNADLSFEKLEYVAYFFLQALSHAALALLFSLLFKRSGIAIGVFFLYAVVLENMLSGLLNYLVNNAGRYLPLQSNYKLIPFPFFRNIVNQFIDKPNVLLLLSFSIAYLVAYFVISIRKFQTDDL